MSDEVISRKYTPEEQDDIRRQLNELKAAEGGSWSRITAESGIPTGTLSSWALGTYKSDGSNIAARVERYLRSRETRQALERVAVNQASYVATPTGERIVELLQHAQHVPDVVTIVGAPGTGKTSALCYYTRNSPNVFKFVADNTMNSVPALLRTLSVALDIHRTGSQDQMSRAIMRKLQLAGQALIIVDEAQHLTPLLFDQLRVYHDQCGAGLALAGNADVVRLVKGGSTGRDFSQLTSRVGMRLSRPKPIRGDAEALLDAWKVDDPKVREALRALAQVPGGLRNMSKCHRIAGMVANRRDSELTPELVAMAWRQISGNGGLEAVA